MLSRQHTVSGEELASQEPLYLPAGEGMKEAATAQLLLAANEPKNYQSERVASGADSTFFFF